MVSGAPRASFELCDHFGNAVTERSFGGKHLLVYFGFTHCREVCPRSLAKLSSVLDRLGSQGDEIVPLYVTVDPARDTAAVMRDYLERDYPRFIGLTGTDEQVALAKKAFRVFAERAPSPADPDGYDVPHTAISYLMAPDGSYLAHFTDVLDEAAIAARIAGLLGATTAH